MESWLPALPVVVEVEGKRGRSTHADTHTARLRAHCSSTHTFILSPIFGTRFAQTNTAFLGGGEKVGEGAGAFLFQLAFTSLTSALFPPSTL